MRAVHDHGDAHHIQRLMVLPNLATSAGCTRPRSPTDRLSDLDEVRTRAREVRRMLTADRL